MYKMYLPFMYSLCVQKNEDEFTKLETSRGETFIFFKIIISKFYILIPNFPIIFLFVEAPLQLLF